MMSAGGQRDQMVAGRARTPHPELLPDENSPNVALSPERTNDQVENRMLRSAWAAFTVYARSRYIRRHHEPSIVDDRNRRRRSDKYFRWRQTYAREKFLDRNLSSGGSNCKHIFHRVIGTES